MQPIQFDQAKADALIQQIGTEIVKGSKYQARPWTDLVVVATFVGSESLFGYVFWGQNEWTAAAPDGFDALYLLSDFHEATRVPGRDHWKKCRVRITRATGKIDIDFDYEGDKWIPKMSDPAGFAFSLRE